MGKPYSQDLRERVIAAVDTGTGAYVAAPLFRVSVSYIYKALIRRRITGEVTARRSGGGPKPKLASHDDALRERIAAEPDITLAESASLAARRAEGQSQRRVPVEQAQFSQTLAQKKSERAAEQDRPDVAQARNEWRASQGKLNPERLVFIDETGARNRHGAPLWPLPARSAPGIRCAVGTLEDNNIRRRAAGRADRRALCVQWTDGWPELSRLCRAVRGPDPAPGRASMASRMPATLWLGRLAPSCATCPRTAQTSTPSNSSSLNSKPCCERPPPEPSKPSSQQSPKPSTMSARKSAKTTSQTKAIAANHENALAREYGIVPWNGDCGCEKYDDGEVDLMMRLENQTHQSPELIRCRHC